MGVGQARRVGRRLPKGNMGKTRPMAAAQLAVMSPEGGLSRYLAEIRKFPMLAKDEEFMLAKRWREHEDPEAAHKLVTSHLRRSASHSRGSPWRSWPRGAGGW